MLPKEQIGRGSPPKAPTEVFAAEYNLTKDEKRPRCYDVTRIEASIA